MKKQPRSYGLCCHWAIITICHLTCIKDMFAKVSGSPKSSTSPRASSMGSLTRESANSWLISSRKSTTLCPPWSLHIRGPWERIQSQKMRSPNIIGLGGGEDHPGNQGCIWSGLKRAAPELPQPHTPQCQWGQPLEETQSHAVESQGFCCLFVCLFSGETNLNLFIYK